MTTKRPDDWWLPWGVMVNGLHNKAYLTSGEVELEVRLREEHSYEAALEWAKGMYAYLNALEACAAALPKLLADFATGSACGEHGDPETHDSVHASRDALARLNALRGENTQPDYRNQGPGTRSPDPEQI